MEDDEYYKKFAATQMFDKISWHFRSNMVTRTNQKYLVTSIKNSFLGKEAVDFLAEEMPKLFPDKPMNRANLKKLVEMMYEWKIIVDPVSMKSQEAISVDTNKGFRESRIYVFGKTLEQLRQPMKRSRRSASFNGVRKSIQNVEEHKVSESPAAMQPIRKNRRLSRSNGNLSKIGDCAEPIATPVGHENKGFDENADTENSGEREHIYEKKEKNYDWLPFFKSKRFQAKQQEKTPKRSVSLDRNHVNLMISPKTSPKSSDDCVVVLHPTGEPMKLTKNVSRSKLYESIARRQQHTPVAASNPVRDNRVVWKSELIRRLSNMVGKPLPPEFTHRIDGFDIEFNANPKHYDIDGVVKSRTTRIQPEYPALVLQFMEYLRNYPFLMTNEHATEQNVCKIFSTLVNRLGDLDAPLMAHEAALLVDILSKHEHFAEMFETSRPRRWAAQLPVTPRTADELDGFSKELPVCGVRASMHRRKVVSPAELHSSIPVPICPIQAESSYKLRESWLITALQLVLLTIPTARRRKLHKYLTFMRTIVTNEVIDLSELANGCSNNWEAAITGLWIGVCGGFKQQQGIVIAAILLANYRVLFSPPDDFYSNIRASLIPGEMTRYSKIERGRKIEREPPIYGTYTAPETGKQSRSFFNRLLKRS